jgi:hypothetical protein
MTLLSGSTAWSNSLNFKGLLKEEEGVFSFIASFHLEGEANQRWQWLRRAYQEEGRMVTWQSLKEELWARFGPTECEDFDKALSRERQYLGSLRDYQKEFERLGNRVHGWTCACTASRYSLLPNIILFVVNRLRCSIGNTMGEVVKV